MKPKKPVNFSYSRLKKLQKRPLSVLDETPPDYSDAAKLGILTGVLTLEPHNFGKRVEINEKPKKPTKIKEPSKPREIKDQEKHKLNMQAYEEKLKEYKKDKKNYDLQLEIYNNYIENPEKKIRVSQAMYDQALAMSESIKSKPNAQYLLDDAEKEKTLIYTCKEYGFQCKAILDALTILEHPETQEQKAIIVDIKTTTSWSIRNNYAIGRHITDNGYHLQAAMYCDAVQQTLGIDNIEYIILYCETDHILIDNTYHHGVHYVTLSNEDIEKSTVLLNQGKEQWKHCLEHGFSDYSDAPKTDIKLYIGD